MGEPTAPQVGDKVKIGWGSHDAPGSRGVVTRVSTRDGFTLVDVAVTYSIPLDHLAIVARPADARGGA